MTQDDIIRMAREAGLVSSAYDSGFMERFTIKLERFSALVAAAEREECAKVADYGQSALFDPMHDLDCAAAIRARSKI